MKGIMKLREMEKDKEPITFEGHLIITVQGAKEFHIYSTMRVGFQLGSLIFDLLQSDFAQITKKIERFKKTLGKEEHKDELLQKK